jgi:transposase
MQSSDFIGIDVAKATLEIATADATSPTQTLTNDRTALSTWLATLPATAQLALESTGRYHELAVELAGGRGLPVYLVNPRALHHYAKAVHRGAKTDRLDACLIARYLAHEPAQLRPYTPPSSDVQELLRLQRHRAQLMVTLTSLRQSLADLDVGRSEQHDALQRLRQLIAAIDARSAELLAAEPARADLAQRLATIPGFGPLNSRHCATLLPQLAAPRLSAVISYVGLDPRPRDSGTFKGRRKLSKHGPAETRRLLYLAAMAAARYDPDWQTLKDQLIARGRSTTEAFCILARRLLRIAYALYHDGGVYDPTKLAPEAGHAT